MVAGRKNVAIWPPRYVGRSFGSNACSHAHEAPCPTILARAWHSVYLNQVCLRFVLIRASRSIFKKFYLNAWSLRHTSTAVGQRKTARFEISIFSVVLVL